MTEWLKDPENVAECSFDDIHAAVRRLWPGLFTKTRDDDFAPIVDGHWRAGFSLRLFGPSATIAGTCDPDPTFETRHRAASRAMEQLQCALEDIGFETTRRGNAWQDGRLVLGWAIAVDGTRLVDLSGDHPAWTERRVRLADERAARATPKDPDR